MSYYCGWHAIPGNSGSSEGRIRRKAFPPFVSALRQKVATGIAFPWKNLSVDAMEGPAAQQLAQLQAVYDGARQAWLSRSWLEPCESVNRQLAEIGGRGTEEYLAEQLGR